MSERDWRNVSLILAVACALLLGVSAAFVLQSGAGSSASPELAGGSPSGSSVASTPSAGLTSPAASGTVPTEAPTASSSIAATPSPTPSSTPRPTPTPKPTPSAPTATITFNELMLDAQVDPLHSARTFTFTSDGPGPVVMQVLKTSPQGTTKMCVSVDGGAPACTSGAKPGFPYAEADTAHSTWTVTLLGVDIFTPTVDVSFSWPTHNPSIRLEHGRFQGSGSGVPDALRGFSATFTARAAGTLGCQAAWTTIQATADLSLADLTGSPALNVDEQQWSQAQQLSWSHGLSAGHIYRLRLADLSADNYRPDLTATITFP